MKAPQIPSFFKSSTAKKFNFQPRYYNETKERIENLKNKENIKFKRKKHKKNKFNRLIRIIILVVFLYIIAYNYLIN